MALTEYQKFVKKNASKHKLKNGMVDLKTIGRLWRQKKGGKKAKPKKRTQRSTRGSTTVTTRRTSALSKPKPKSRSKGPEERKRLAYKKTLDDYARALGVPVSKVTIKTVKGSTVVRIGSLIKVKRASMRAAVVEARKRARKRI